LNLLETVDAKAAAKATPAKDDAETPEQLQTTAVD
jgi:hypothetical protein